MKISWILLGIVAAVALWLIWAYNRFVALTNRCEEGWSDIEVQMKRRYDLIPNLVETVKGYVKHEAGTLEKVTEARTKAMGAQSVGEHAQAENMLTGALKSLFAVAESYPTLQANPSFVELQRELADTENKIQAARRFYNSVVIELQNALEQFPTNLVGKSFGFKTRDFFELILSVSGVGPKTALSVLRRASRESLEGAIGSRDLNYLTKVVGLGKKSAEKMLVELADKVGPQSHSKEDGEVFDTLVALGYTEREARKTLQSIPSSAVGKEARLKAALSLGHS